MVIVLRDYPGSSPAFPTPIDKELLRDELNLVLSSPYCKRVRFNNSRGSLQIAFHMDVGTFTENTVLDNAITNHAGQGAAPPVPTEGVLAVFDSKGGLVEGYTDLLGLNSYLGVTLDTSSDSRTPTSHASSHNDGGSDELTITSLGGFPGGTTNFLRADGTFAAPPGGGGGVSGPGSSTDNALPRWDGTGGDTLQNSIMTVDDGGDILVSHTSDMTFQYNTEGSGFVAFRLTELGDYLGGFIKYDAGNNDLFLGTHETRDFDESNDVHALKIDRNSTNVQILGALELAAITAPSTPSGGVGRLFKQTGSNPHLYWRPAEGGEVVVTRPAPETRYVSSTTDTTTSGGVITGMTVTPATGSYLVWFDSDCDPPDSDGNTIEIKVGGTQVAESVRTVNLYSNDEVGITTQARVTVNGAQAIEVHYTGTSATFGARNLMVILVTPN